MKWVGLVSASGIRLAPCPLEKEGALVAASYIAAYGLEHLRRAGEIGVLCVGTDRSTGDSLGPLVGTILSRRPGFSGRVWGTLDSPVHAVNLENWMEENHRRLTEALLVAVDACLGKADNVGTMRIAPGPLRPGSGLSKHLPPVGHVAVTGTVNVGGFLEFAVLQNTRLSVVYRLAGTIASALEAAVGLLSSGVTAEDIDDLPAAHLSEGAVEGADCPKRLRRGQANQVIHLRSQIIQGILRGHWDCQGCGSCTGLPQGGKSGLDGKTRGYAVID